MIMVSDTKWLFSAYQRRHRGSHFKSRIRSSSNGFESGGSKNIDLAYYILNIVFVYFRQQSSGTGVFVVLNL